MRPLRGVITRYNHKYMKIELESGNTITMRPVEHLSRGEVVEVFYDFTHNRVANICIKGEEIYSQPDKPEYIDEEEHTEIEVETEFIPTFKLEQIIEVEEESKDEEIYIF